VSSGNPGSIPGKTFTFWLSFCLFEGLAMGWGGEGPDLFLVGGMEWCERIIDVLSLLQVCLQLFV
jgi:hypothetical protein